MTPRARLAELIAGARRIVAFTGAGISTESGVPDFRSPGGVWSKIKPIYFDEFVGSEDRRREAWTRTFSGTAGWTGARPNAGHAALARLVASGRMSAVITQNVDNLHQDSGVPADQVIELHGNASYAACLACGLPLFRSQWKFDSGTGWPSFFQAIDGNLGRKTDLALLQPRTEYHCAQCLGHQGHVFDDGPRPTGLRYCNDGVALRFIPA